MISDIDAALTAALVNGTSLPVATENEPFDPPVANPWLSAWFMPNLPSAFSLGAHGEDEIDGVFQIDVNTEIGIGRGDAGTIAQQLIALYPPGMGFVHNGQAVRVVSCGRSSGRRADNWWRVSVTVTWQAHLQRGL